VIARTAPASRTAIAASALSMLLAAGCDGQPAPAPASLPSDIVATDSRQPFPNCVTWLGRPLADKHSVSQTDLLVDLVAPDRLDPQVLPVAAAQVTAYCSKQPDPYKTDLGSYVTESAAAWTQLGGTK
jgi:hypothetical protein